MDVMYKNVLYKMIPLSSDEYTISYICIIFHPFVGNEPLYREIISRSHYLKTTTFYSHHSKRSWNQGRDKDAEAFIDNLTLGMTAFIGELGGGILRKNGRILKEDEDTKPKEYRKMKFFSKTTELRDFAEEILSYQQIEGLEGWDGY